MINQPVNSEFTPENLKETEEIWSKLPTNKNWGNLETHEKIIVINIIQQLKEDSHFNGYSEGFGEAYSEGVDAGITTLLY